MESKRKKAIIAFMGITLVLSAVFYYFIIARNDMSLAVWLMWAPGVAAIITKLLFLRGEKNVLGLRLANVKYILAALLLPAHYLGISYMIYWVITPVGMSGNLNAVGGTGMALVMMLGLYFISGIVGAAGEEIGWRGFLFPQLNAAWGFRQAVLLNGVIWAVWHFPVMITGSYMSGTPLWYQLPMFTAVVLCVTLMLATLTVASNSVWPAVVFHATHNFLDQTIFTNLSPDPSRAWYAGETGWVTLIVAAILALLVSRKHLFAKKDVQHV